MGVLLLQRAYFQLRIYIYFTGEIIAFFCASMKQDFSHGFCFTNEKY